MNIVLVEPEIPQNTGNIGRLCLAVGATLHLIEPFGFELSDRYVKRAGLDYWEHVPLRTYSDWKGFRETVPENAQWVFFSKKAGRTLYEWSFQPDVYLIFGCETRGLPEELINQNALDTARIPMMDARVRSLNLANAVSIAAYEVVRQTMSSHTD